MTNFEFIQKFEEIWKSPEGCLKLFNDHPKQFEEVITRWVKKNSAESDAFLALAYSRTKLTEEAAQAFFQSLRDSLQ